MRKEILGIIILLTISCALGTVHVEQEVNQQGWRDFDTITRIVDSTDSAVQNLYNNIIILQNEKASIIDNAERLAEITKIFNIHPDHNMANIQARLATFETLRAYLVDNGYVE